MKRLILAGSSLAAVAAAGSAGAVDVTLGGSIDLGWEFGLGKKADATNGFSITPGKQYQNVVLSFGAVGTTDAGLKFGGKLTLSTSEELKLNLYDTNGTVSGGKRLVKLKNSSATARIKGKAYNISGGAAVTAGQVVSVKINSNWFSAKTAITEHVLSVSSLLASTDVCKIAGQGRDMNGAAGDAGVARDGVAAADIGTADAYLPAGQVTAAGGAEKVRLTAKDVGYIEASAVAAVDADGDTDDFGWKVGYTAGAGVADADAYADKAKVYAGPFMEVKLTSSTTKMVVGAVCVTNKFSGSETAAYLNVASRIAQISDASVFIEGGFGKLSLSTSKYGGYVAQVGSSGEEVEVNNSGVVAEFSSISLLGFSVSGAVDIGSINLQQRPNYSIGTTFDMLGLAVTVEMEDEYTDSDLVTSGVQNIFIDKWDASATYSFDDLSVALSTDSSRDWGLSAAYDFAGTSFKTVIQNVAKRENKKSGLSIDSSVGINVNGIQVNIGLDERLAWSGGLSYSLGGPGFNAYASYSSADGGGTMGAKLSF